MNSWIKYFVLAMLLAFSFAPEASACSTCFGNPDSKMTQGVMAGVLVLLFVVVAVLGGFVALFVHFARRSAAAALEAEAAKSKA